MEDTMSSAQKTAAPALGRMRTWMWDFACFGAIAGLAHASMLLIQSRGGADLAMFIFLPLFTTIQGILVGATIGATLRVLRGRVPAAIGVATATLAAVMASTLPGLMVGVEMLEPARFVRGLPMTIAVMAMVPLLAVFRAQQKPTMRWVLLVGAVAGALIVPASMLVSA